MTNDQEDSQEKDYVMFNGKKIPLDEFLKKKENPSKGSKMVEVSPGVYKTRLED